MTLDEIMNRIRRDNPGISYEEAAELALTEIRSYYDEKQKHKRRNYTEKEKIEYLRKLLKGEKEGKKASKIAAELKIPSSTLATWKKNKRLYKKAAELEGISDVLSIANEPDDVISIAIANHGNRIRATHALPPAENDPTYMNYVQNHDIDINITDYEKEAYIKYLTANFEALGMDQELALSNARAMAEDRSKLRKWVLENRQDAKTTEASPIVVEPNITNDAEKETQMMKDKIAEVNYMPEDVMASLTDSTPKTQEKEDEDLSKEDKKEEFTNGQPYFDEPFTSDLTLEEPKEEIPADAMPGISQNASEAMALSKFEKMKNWIKSHKKGVIIAAVVAAGVVAASAISAITGDASFAHQASFHAGDLNMVTPIVDTISNSNVSDLAANSDITNIFTDTADVTELYSNSANAAAGIDAVQANVDAGPFQIADLNNPVTGEYAEIDPRTLTADQFEQLKNEGFTVPAYTNDPSVIGQGGEEIAQQGKMSGFGRSF